MVRIIFNGIVQIPDRASRRAHEVLHGAVFEEGGFKGARADVATEVLDVDHAEKCDFERFGLMASLLQQWHNRLSLALALGAGGEPGAAAAMTSPLWSRNGSRIATVPGPLPAGIRFGAGLVRTVTTFQL